MNVDRACAWEQTPTPFYQEKQNSGYFHVLMNKIIGGGYWEFALMHMHSYVSVKNREQNVGNKLL